MQIQWYPGQMAKAKRLLREHLKLVDAVIEVLDARIPYSSRNPDLRKMLEAKPVVAAMTRSDLADPENTAAWQQVLSREYFAAAAVNAASGEGVKKLQQALSSLPRRAGRETRPLRIMVVGIPNVGKSSLINRLTGRGAAATGDKPGITRGKQWVRAGDGLEILDTPGLLWPKITSSRQAFGLAAVGSVKDEIIDIYQLGVEMVEFLQKAAPESLRGRYNIQETEGDSRELLEAVGRKRGCLVRGGTVDTEAAAFLVVKDFREGRLGRISLEKAGEQWENEEGFCRHDGAGNHEIFNREPDHSG